jgi:hypothetical protein
MGVRLFLRTVLSQWVGDFSVTDVLRRWPSSTSDGVEELRPTGERGYLWLWRSNRIEVQSLPARMARTGQ